MTDDIPDPMGPPVAATADIKPTNIKFTWTALSTAATNGGDAVSHYSLEWLNTTANPDVF